MFLGLLTLTYSSNVNSNFAPSSGTPMTYGRGSILTITGGMVSLRPPVGAWEVLAQECENIAPQIIRSTGNTGKYLFQNSFIICLS